MEDISGVKSRCRSNSARVLVFSEPKPNIRLEQRQTSLGESSYGGKQRPADHQNDSSNLVKLRNSSLGKSAPSLSLNMKDTSSIGRRNSRSAAIHRLSFVANTSPILPRSHSPVCGSPLDSPRTHNCLNNFTFAPIKRAERESYGDSAVGYVELKRANNICIVKCKICPEHRVRAKNYTVVMEINEAEEKILKAQCLDCAASEGGCKHAIAFVMWVHRRSEEPSPTDVVSYWKKPKLSGVGTSLQFVKVQDFSNKAVEEVVHPNTNFLEQFIDKANERGVSCQLLKYFYEDKLSNLGIHQLLCSFHTKEKQTADEFIIYAASKMSTALCNEAFSKTKEQSECGLWHDLRYGRITASKIFEASRCKTVEGSLVENIIGASKIYDTPALKRGRDLEESVIRVVEKKLQIKLFRGGLMLSQEFPILGASPDAYNDEIVVEIKCPSSEKTVSSYMVNGVINNRYLAQIQLQMLLMQKKSGVFCVADPVFEENSEVTLIHVSYNEDFLKPIIEKSLEFWKTNIYNVLIK